ncbi:MAG: malectin domain-containing carbohydrate-binding protein [Armatimonas sp.]
MSRPQSIAGTQVIADFAIAESFPLLKDKFNLYNTAIPSTTAFERDAALLSELSAESIRIEHNWGFGQTLSGSVGGPPQELQFDWKETDYWQRLANTQGLFFHWGYDYSPVGKHAVQPPLALWEKVVYTAAAHHRAVGLPILYHEVWNEPDNPPTFFSGTQQQYFELYRTGVKAIRSADPDAKVGGPTTAFDKWTEAFVEYVRTQNLPLDFFSIHQYGAPGLAHISGAARALSRWPHFHTTELILDEYHTYFGWKKGAPQDTYVGATELLHDFLTFLEHPEITSINWAQFQDPGDFGDQFLGLITLDGKRKASFNAFQIYGRMPPERKRISVTGAPVEAAASCDSHRASALVLNRSGASQTVALTLKNVPFARGTVRLYTIDRTHNSYLDGANEILTPLRTWPDALTADWTWSGEMADKTTLYVEVEDGSGATDSPLHAAARVIRVNRYYPARGTRSYSDFDARTWIVRQGMNGERLADQQVGVLADALPRVLELRAILEGELAHQDVNSLLGVRFDYGTGRGNSYRKGVLFHGPLDGTDLYEARHSVSTPFGTQRPADQVVRVPDLARFLIEPTAYAPADWNGRIAITFLLINAGPAARLRWTVRAQADRVIAINAGSRRGAGEFQPDAGFSAGGNLFGVNEAINTAGIVGAAPPALYQSEHSGGAFWHTTSGLKPKHIYKVRLHFAEFYWKEPGKRLFNIAINDQTVLERFDIVAAAGGDHRAVVREFFVAANSRGSIHLHFTPVRDNTKISGIEVLDTLSKP